MQKGFMNSLHFTEKEGKTNMLKAYVAVGNKVKDFLADKRAVSHLLEVVGVLALAALILVVLFPGARDTINNIWQKMADNITRVLGEQPAQIIVPGE